ncbi:hypothetical protein P4575_04780 [Priestia megaterium]|uniref:hypothetical protein n=1 Tax=Priestia megaterium TaxID=1404 RepID=UPI002E1E6EDA|nr:hypothetical protein [Priestia megaterium]
MDNLKRAINFFFNSVSAAVFPQVKRWKCTTNENEGIAELVQVNKSLKDNQVILVHLEVYSDFVTVSIFNADKNINRIINRLFYSFCSFKVETFIDVAATPNISSSQRIPTSDLNKEIMSTELKVLEESINLLNNEEAKLEKIRNLKRGIKMYEQFKINTQKKHLI